LSAAVPPRALVVGASRGLGLGLAGLYLERGWRVDATWRDPAGRAAPAALAPAGRLALHRLELTDPTGRAALLRDLAPGPFDLVLLNAGILGPRGAAAGEIDAATLVQVMTTNALAPVALAEALARRVRPGTGVLAFMTSRMGSVALNTSGGTVLYRASKAASSSLTRSLVAGLQPLPFTVLSIDPGHVRTAMGGAAAPLDVATSARSSATACGALPRAVSPPLRRYGARPASAMPQLCSTARSGRHPTQPASFPTASTSQRPSACAIEH
jgi:NAD(P)-dependent dehydrogenase (short-subunit alcohol dehydrogenase family)